MKKIRYSNSHNESALSAVCPDKGFDCVLMDPPWENASAQRSSAYPTLPSRNLLGISMKRLLNQVCIQHPIKPGVMTLCATMEVTHGAEEAQRRFLQISYMPPTKSVGNSRCSAQMPPYKLRLSADRLFVTHTYLHRTSSAAHRVPLPQALA